MKLVRYFDINVSKTASVALNEWTKNLYNLLNTASSLIAAFAHTSVCR